MLRRMAFLALSRSRLIAALGDAPVKLNVKSSCRLSWCGGMKVLAASACRPCPLPSAPPRHVPILGMAIGAEVPCAYKVCTQGKGKHADIQNRGALCINQLSAALPEGPNSKGAWSHHNKQAARSLLNRLGESNESNSRWD